MKSKQNGFGLLEFIVVAAVVLLLAVLVAVLIEESDERAAWDVFMVEHDCRIVAHRQGFSTSNVAPIFNSNGGISVGMTTSTTPAQVAYECNDGITYWRNK